MSEPAPSRQPDAQEPSMEDILASIRRILAEDPAAGEEEPARAPADRVLEIEEETEVDAPPPHAIRAAGSVMEDEAPAPRTSPDRWGRPEDIVEDEPPSLPPVSRRAARGGSEDPFRDEAPSARREDVFVLQPNMRTRGHTLVSDEPASDSTDVLSQLARAILNRRDIAVGERHVTLEGMVREMLRPLLHEWLDRNLPYLIERLVKKEIDLMINRAERLED